MKFLTYIYIIVLILCASSLQAQTDRQHVRLGNKYFRAKEYNKAEVEYKKALSKNKHNSQALYNLACVTLHKTNVKKNDSIALEQFKSAAEMEKDKTRKAMSYHNMGVILQSYQDYAQAIVAYKEALRNNPRDNKTRYNLALCQKLLKNQKQNKQQNKQDKDKKQQQKQQDKQQPKQDKKKNNKQKQQQQSGMSKDNAKQLLNAAMQRERETQKKMQKGKQQQGEKQLQKNW